MSGQTAYLVAQSSRKIPVDCQRIWGMMELADWHRIGPFFRFGATFRLVQEALPWEPGSYCLFIDSVRPLLDVSSLYCGRFGGANAV